MEKMTGDKVGRFHPKKPENPAERLTNHIWEISAIINRDIRARFGINNFLTAKTRINMSSYAQRGSISPEQLGKDKRRIKEFELKNCGLASNTPEQQTRALQHFKGKYKTDDLNIILRRTSSEQERQKSSQFEMIATSLFYKFFYDNFIIARTTLYDDYFNNVDTLLINRKTGEAICAFDEIKDYKDNTRFQEKQSRLKTLNKNQGASVKYGFAMHQGLLIEQEIANLPVFYLDISEEDFNSLLSGYNFDLNQPPAEVEFRIMEMFLAGLNRQWKKLEKSPSRNPVVRKNLEDFKRSLKTMQETFYKKRSEMA